MLGLGLLWMANRTEHVLGLGFLWKVSKMEYTLDLMIRKVYETERGLLQKVHSTAAGRELPVDLVG